MSALHTLHIASMIASSAGGFPWEGRGYSPPRPKQPEENKLACLAAAETKRARKAAKNAVKAIPHHNEQEAP